MEDNKDREKNPVSVKKGENLGGRGYICHRLLGKGAFSRVYQAESRDGKSYACKISNNPEMLEKEAAILAKLRHPLFPAFYEFWKEDGTGFLVMEFVVGSSLETMVRRRGGFTSEQVIRTGTELAEGLLYLHERTEKYLFRDVKPANIMIRQDGKVKLLDCGCVCSMNEKQSSRAGTLGYAAPEQLEVTGELTESCDVYGLGRTLQSMLGSRGEGVWRWQSRRRRQGVQWRRRQGVQWWQSGQRRQGVQWRQRKNAKKLTGELNFFLEACIRRAPGERIANMRDVMLMFTEMSSSRNCTWRQEAFCRKNIWDSMYKRP